MFQFISDSVIVTLKFLFILIHFHSNQNLTVILKGQKGNIKVSLHHKGPCNDHV